MKLDNFLTLYPKINTKCIKDLNMRPETIKMQKRAEAVISLTKYWDYIKIKSFCTVKETVNKTKRQPIEWEKIFANDIFDKGLVSKIYRELIQFNTPQNK